MTRYLDGTARRLDHDWHLALTPAGSIATPADLAGAADVIDAPVPGTVAAALSAAGRFDPAAATPLTDQDSWYFCRLSEPAGPAVLQLDGLATVAEVFWNGRPLLTSRSMFLRHQAAVEVTGDDELAICLRALTEEFGRRTRRARWRPALIDQQGLRLLRTTLLGHMPGWCPSIEAVGPYREVSLVRPGALAVDDLRIRADLVGDDTGLLEVSATGDLAGWRLRCDGRETGLVADGRTWRARLELPGIEPWWPASHGHPRLYPIQLVAADQVVDLARTGFRRLEVDRGAVGDGFALVVNGVPAFCRGVVWTSADLLGLDGSRATYAPILQQLVDAGANMVRVPGIATYESAAFFELCDELGLMVWQDVMLANCDYPASDEEFRGLLDAEVRQFLDDRQGCPSLTVLCGGSEVSQQAAMLGLPDDLWYSPLVTELIPALAAELRPDLAYVANSPCGGPLPFSVDAGVGHYYGVGAYQRPLDDARRANVRFASECLAFSHVPDDDALGTLAISPVHDPRWKAGVPRDPGSTWDFEDTRDYYLGLLYGLDPARLRREEAAAYLDYSRATTTEVLVETIAEWRRPGSSCRGALVFAGIDLAPGAGWGVLDHRHRPKPVFRGLARAFRPLTVLVTDEGVNGLRVHLINETAGPVDARLELFALRDGCVPIANAGRDLRLAGRESLTLDAAELYGGFFDYGYAYRFGPCTHQVVVARLTPVTGEPVEAVTFPVGRRRALFTSRLQAEPVRQGSGWALQLATDCFAQSIQVHVTGYSTTDDWFHLLPDRPRLIGLVADPGTDPGRPPSGEVRSLAGSSVRF